MARKMYSYLMIAALAGVPVLVGCDKKISEEKTTVRKSDGTTATESKETTKSPDGTVKEKTVEKSNNP